MIVEPLQVIIETAFGKTKLVPGCSTEQMAAAEARLKVALPETLKDYFSVAGNIREMMDADFHVLTPEKLKVDGRHLVFCEENQGGRRMGHPREGARE